MALSEQGLTAIGLNLSSNQAKLLPSLLSLRRFTLITKRTVGREWLILLAFLSGKGRESNRQPEAIVLTGDKVYAV